MDGEREERRKQGKRHFPALFLKYDRHSGCVKEKKGIRNC